MSLEHGSCQCGAVRYSVELDMSKPAATCNCSRCGRLGSMFLFAPRAGFTLESGDDSLTSYLFNSGTIRHQFCSVCGIESFALGTMPDGTETVAVNARTLDGVDPRALETTFHDGAAR